MVVIKLITAVYFIFICLLCTSHLAAQSNTNTTGIPSDLLIVLKMQEGWGGSYSETTITANGDYSVQVRSAYPIKSVPNILTVNGKSIKPPKYLKPKISNEKLQQLLAEFERIQFFKFGKDFPQEDAKEAMSLSDQGTEIISIRTNGETKEVSNYLGDSLKRTRLLRDLAEKIRGAGIWNFENGEIPENFEVQYRAPGEDRIVRDFKIGSNGKIVESSFTIDLFKTPKGTYGSRITKPKTVAKLSKRQLRQLMDEFERVGFSGLGVLTKYDGCSDASPWPFEKIRSIRVQINNVQMGTSLDKNCNPKAETDAAKFEYMDTVIRSLLIARGIKNI